MTMTRLYKKRPVYQGILRFFVRLVGETGFEPATSWTRTTRSTSLSYTPNRTPKSILSRDCELRQFTQAFFESTFRKGRQRRKRLICLALSEARSVRKPP
jgi:hypothetical protein